MIYLDSSAIVKLVVREDELAALRRFLRDHRVQVSCSLARVGCLARSRAREPPLRIEHVRCSAP